MALSFTVIYAIRYMLYAIRYMLYAIWDTLCAIRYTPYILYALYYKLLLEMNIIKNDFHFFSGIIIILAGIEKLRICTTSNAANI